MSPASCGRRAVLSLLSLSLISAGLVVPFASAEARGGGGHAPAPAMHAPPRVTGAVQAPAVHRPGHGSAPHALGRPAGGQQGGQAGWQQHWRRPSPGVTTYQPSFTPQASWPQQHFRRPAAVAAASPHVIYAPQAAAEFEPSLVDTHGEPPVAEPHYHADHAPCTAPLIIHIGTGATQHGVNGVRVVHGQNSGCGTPQVVTYRGPRVIETTPVATGAAIQRTRKAGKRAKTGFTVVRARF